MKPEVRDGFLSTHTIEQCQLFIAYNNPAVFSEKFPVKQHFYDDFPAYDSMGENAVQSNVAKP